MYAIQKSLSAALCCLLFFAGLSVQAQQNPVYLLNSEAINLKTGISLASYQQSEEVVLSLAEPALLADYDALVVYLARGNRPLVKQEMSMQKHQQMSLQQLLKTARTGDRLVIELLKQETEGDGPVVTVFLY
jgi:hypothetical protein